LGNDELIGRVKISFDTQGDKKKWNTTLRTVLNLIENEQF
jgi:hypothetical protein